MLRLELLSAEIVRVNHFAESIDSCDDVLVSSVPTGAPHVYKIDYLRSILAVEAVKLRMGLLQSMRDATAIDQKIADSRNSHLATTVSLKQLERKLADFDKSTTRAQEVQDEEMMKTLEDVSGLHTS